MNKEKMNAWEWENIAIVIVLAVTLIIAIVALVKAGKNKGGSNGGSTTTDVAYATVWYGEDGKQWQNSQAPGGKDKILRIEGANIYMNNVRASFPDSLLIWEDGIYEISLFMVLFQNSGAKNAEERIKIFKNNTELVAQSEGHADTDSPQSTALMCRTIIPLKQNDTIKATYFINGSTFQCTSFSLNLVQIKS